MTIFPLFYAGNVAYFKALLKHKDELIFERFEYFPKQTYRNRMEILGPNGLQKLVIPTLKTGGRRRMDDVQISYAENWQKDHWKSLEAAYRRSAYFEFYEHRFKPFYREETPNLWTFNLNLLKLIDELLTLELDYLETGGYEEDYKLDFRASAFEGQETENYLQVFSDRYPFTPNLSIIDALFNLGPQARELLH